jgi:hypothetical protein
MRYSTFLFGGILGVAYAMPILPLDHPSSLQMKRQPEANHGYVLPRDPAVNIDLGGLSVKREAVGSDSMVVEPKIIYD